MEQDYVIPGRSQDCKVQKRRIQMKANSNKIRYYSRYREERYFYQKDGNWYFDINGDKHCGMSRNDDGSLYHVDPSGGPFVSLKTNLNDLHKDLPDAKIKAIEFDKAEDAYKLTV